MKKLDILFDKSINSKRVVVTTDRYNWIIMEGSQKLSWKNFQRKAKHSYFSKLESLYLNLYSILFKEIPFKENVGMFVIIKIEAVNIVKTQIYG